MLSCVGGLDIAAMTGLYLGAAYYRITVVIDGLISAAAALAAYNIIIKQLILCLHLIYQKSLHI